MRRDLEEPFNHNFLGLTNVSPNVGPWKILMHIHVNQSKLTPNYDPFVSWT